MSRTIVKWGFAKFRCGVAPIRIETGRYDNTRENDRICPICNCNIENETHVILYCHMYKDLWDVLFAKACEVDANFNNFNDSDKMKFLFSCSEMVALCAKPVLIY